MLGTILNLILSAVFVVGGVVGYIPQYLDIRSSRNSRGFSIFICFILLLANILRVFFWVGKRFEVTLLLQSLVMIVAQLALLELIIRVNRGSSPGRSSSIKQQQHHHDSFSSIRNVLDYQQFWNWDHFLEYMIFLVLLVGFIGNITMINLLTVQSQSLVELTGVLALMCEAILGVPQVYRNYVTKSAAGLRWELLLSWFLGDGFKTFYFIYKKSPAQFIACGVIQLVVDCVIGLQMFVFYRTSSVGSDASRSLQHKQQQRDTLGSEELVAIITPPPSTDPPSFSSKFHKVYAIGDPNGSAAVLYQPATSILDTGSSSSSAASTVALPIDRRMGAC